ncbi:sensor histidine kinase [Kribbella endophytica]
MAVQVTRLRPAQLVAAECAFAAVYGLVAWGLFTHKGQLLPALVGTAFAGLAIALVRRRPAWSAICCLVPLVLTPFQSSLAFVAVPVVCLALFRVADRPRSPVLLAAAEAAVIATALPDFRHTGAVVPFGIMVLAAWIAGRVAAQYRRQSAELALQQERIRIARELHDIVAHSLGVITVQAGYGGLVIDQRPGEARDALATIEHTGRQTLVELRRLLGVLRSDEETQLAPSPGLAQLDELVAQTGKAGVRVELAVTGIPVGLPAGVELSAYRIVQEALTNVVKHAAVTEAQAVVGYQPNELSVRIVDRGAGCTGAPRPGHGLTGLRERVTLYGGTLQAGPLPDRGFEVLARIPLRAETV